jgi:uncharacterized membrane protein
VIALLPAVLIFLFGQQYLEQGIVASESGVRKKGRDESLRETARPHAKRSAARSCGSFAGMLVLTLFPARRATR